VAWRLLFGPGARLRQRDAVPKRPVLTPRPVCEPHRTLPRGRQVWNTRSVDGVHRFLARVYRMCTGEVGQEPATREQLRLLHATIKRARRPACGRVACRCQHGRLCRCKSPPSGRTRLSHFSQVTMSIACCRHALLSECPPES